MVLLAACSTNAPAGRGSESKGTSRVVTGYGDGSQTLTDVLAGTTLTATCSDPAGVMEQETQSLAALENA